MKAALFDMDGLMFDSESIFYRAHTEIAKRYDKPFTLEVQKAMMGRKPIEAIRTMLVGIRLDENPERVLAERNAFYVDLLKTDSEMMPGLVELLDFLDAKNIRKVIATSSDLAWVDILLSRFGLESRFESITTGEEVAHGKPSPDIYLKAMEKLGLGPKDCIVFEDSRNGALAGKAAGCTVVAVPSDFTRDQDFSQFDLVASSLSDPRIKDLIQ